MIRLGLCCKFLEAPIQFRTSTVTHLRKLGDSRKEFLLEILLHNAHALEEAILFCSEHKIGCFRIPSPFFPCYTHPDVGYEVDPAVLKQLAICKQLAQKHDIRLTFHPDQFNVLSTPKPEVLDRTIAELEYQAWVADLVGADVLTIHGGGAYGNKPEALARFAANFSQLSTSVQEKLALENDDKSYTPKDLLPLCEKLHIPLVYDVHHHRCLPDTLSLEEATTRALATWNREPLFHISSPLHGWEGKTPNRHHDYIDPNDFPPLWLNLDPLTIEIEAKAKELAIFALQQELFS